MEFQEYERRMNTDTTGRYDVTPLFADRETFASLVDDLLAPVEAEFTHVVGIEALGFVIGGALARATDAGFVPIRKGGTLPLRDDRVLREGVTDYSGEEKSLELARAAVGDETSALVVDDWVETGAQMRAATGLVEAAGGSVAAITVIRAERTGDTAGLFETYPLYSIG